MKNVSGKLRTIGFKEFRIDAQKYISRVEKGESFTVFRKSRPIFKICPVDTEDVWETVADLSKIHPEGVSIKNVIKALKKVAHGQNA